MALEVRACAERARRLMLPFVEVVRLCDGSSASSDAIRRGGFAMGADGAAYIAPDEAEVSAVEGWLAAHPAARGRLQVTTPTALRAALTAVAEPTLLHNAVSGLAERHPEFSARRTVTRGQALAAVGFSVALVAGLLAAQSATSFAVNMVAAFLFLAVAGLRFVAAAFAARWQPSMTSAATGDVAETPVYTVLVPLHGEAALVEDVVRALLRLDWPREKLDVKLLLEAGDEATIAAARAAVRGTPFEIVTVPHGQPRTKPRALAYALPLARGALITVYDAEDRPHPAQLRRAWEAFRQGSRDLACVQAVLTIDNDDEGWLPRLFAIEYAALFDGLLPALAALGMPVPLGGTSNHFRRRILEKIGGWDAFNVTEDADVGVRLARFGYRTDVIACPTFEEAPIDAGTWLRQRTRWFKGWMQTWLVHTRQPVRLIRDLGLAGAAVFAITSLGIVVSAMVYPIYIATVCVALANPLALWTNGGAPHAAALGLYLFNLVAGHAAMALLSLRALRRRGRGHLALAILSLPVYWLFMSLAAYRAAAELVMRPHHWSKTPHRRHRAATGHHGSAAAAGSRARPRQALPAAGG